jgi:magnesium transporter
MATVAPIGPEARTESSGPRIRIMHRSASGAIDMDWPLDRIAEVLPDTEATLWVDIERPELDLPAVDHLFRHVFHFHPLAIEDALRETHVSKLDDWGHYLYLVFHGLDFDEETDDLCLHELDIFLGRNYLVTCHSAPMPPVESLRRQVERDPERAAKGPDHLLYHILDMGVADYLSAIEHLDEAIDAAQDEVFASPSPQTLQTIFRVKRSAVKVHRVIAPQREVMNRLARDAYAQIDAPDRVYFRDVYDHLVRLHDISESLRDLVSGALDTYLSAIANRTNEIMKALTLVTVMFLPMSFLAGFFGMNFFGENLVLPSGLPRVTMFWLNLVAMAATPVVLWVWSKKRGWF